MMLVGVLPNAAPAEYVCGPTPKTCKIFLDAKAVFTGKVLSVDQTHGLVRLQVQESFKGLPQGTKEVWIDPEWWIEDPGPQYRAGEEWLVFAAEFSRKFWEARFQVRNFDFADKPVFTDGSRCSDAGSRRQDSSAVNAILTELRGYRDGKPLPRGCRGSKRVSRDR
jgi:hypothetical protein